MEVLAKALREILLILTTATPSSDVSLSEGVVMAICTPPVHGSPCEKLARILRWAASASFVVFLLGGIVSEVLHTTSTGGSM